MKVHKSYTELQYKAMYSKTNVVQSILPFIGQQHVVGF